MLLTVYDKLRQKTAILQNAFHITETRRLNAVWTMTFSLPYNDPKHTFCKPFHFVSCNGQLYRILPSGMAVSDVGVRTYACEHVIATLIDKIMFGFNQLGGVGVSTREVLASILSRQSDWVLGDCQLNGYYEYGFEQESLLNAIHGVPSCFTEPYIWEYDTTRYPWVVHLRLIDTTADPSVYLWSRKNMTSFDVETDVASVCTRLYPLGYGEGVNQLTISSVNGGVPYLQAPPDVVERYGIVERAWIDRQYEDAVSLKAAAAKMLAELQEPYTAYRVGVAGLDVSEESALQLGSVVQVSQLELGLKFRSYVTEIVRTYDDVPTVSVVLANKSRDVASTVADIADRVRIESAYAQGATNLVAQTMHENADSQQGAEMNFFIPDSMRIVNKVVCKIKLSSFRAYSKGAAAGGGSTSSASGSFSVSTTSGGSGTASATSGGSVSTSTGSGGAINTSVTGGAVSSSTNAGGGWNGSTGAPARHQGGYADYEVHTHAVKLTAHSHGFSMPAHSHSVNVGGHTHSVKVGGHTHSVSLPSHSHSHSVSGGSHTHTVPDHTHNIVYGIYRGGRSDSFSIYVNDRFVQTVNGTGGEFDITAALTGDDGKIGRNRWHSVSVVPDNQAYVAMDLFVQGFVQSRGDYTV